MHLAIERATGHARRTGDLSGTVVDMETPPDLDQLSEQQVRELAGQLLLEVQQNARTIQRVQLQNEQYKHASWRS